MRLCWRRRCSTGGDRLARSAARRSGLGQALVEFALAAPLFLMVIAAGVEFGLLYRNYLAISYASREGARIGAAAANAANADTQILDTIEVATNTLDRTNVLEVNIYKADADGALTGSFINRYVWDTATSAFVASGTTGWASTSRVRTPPTDALAVQLRFQHRWITGTWFSGGFVLSDRTIMRVEPN